MIVAFTGPSKLNEYQMTDVECRLQELGAKISVWRSGAAFGVDTLVAQFARHFELDLELYVPDAHHNAELVNDAGISEKIIRCSSYRVRNTKMVCGPPEADLLVAFLKRSTFYRSGEWMTVNIAKRLGVPVDMNII